MLRWQEKRTPTLTCCQREPAQPARPAGRLRVQGRRRRGAVRGQGDVDPQARRLALLRAPPRRARVHRPGRLDRLPGHRDGGRGAARRAAVHQAPPAPLQHPPARRQVLSLRGGQPGRGVPARLLHARAPPLRAGLLRPVLQRHAGARDAGPARQAVPVPDLRGARARAAIGGPLPRLLHQALPGAVRRLHRPRGVPAQHRGDHRLPLRPLPRRRARPGAQDGGGRGQRGVRAGRDLSRPPGGGPLADAAPQRRRASRWRPPT